MKKILLLLIVLALCTTVLFSGCLIQVDRGNTGINMNTTDGVDSIPDEFTVSKGSTFAFALEANATTGYTWQVDIGDEDVLELVSNEYEPDDTEDGKVGSGGTTTLTFFSRNKGTTMLSLEYAQDWEGGEIDKTKDIAIIVE